jgi:hypothetical protein
MIRQTKFRGKRVDNGEWVCGYLVHADIIRAEGIAVGTTGMSCKCVIHCDGYRVLPETVGQFVCKTLNTSAHANNSDYLYEGDVVTLGESKTTYKIIRNNYGFFGISNEGDKQGLSTINDLENYEIIGNIHDNPELVKPIKT